MLSDQAELNWGVEGDGAGEGKMALKMGIIYKNEGEKPHFFLAIHLANLIES